jgi:drug/metabolite transporter (DMT)-like permease
LMGNMAHLLNKSCDWQIVAVARSLIPLLLVGGMALSSGVRLVFFRPPVLWMRSLAGSISLVGTFFALTRLPPSDVFTMTNMFPIWVALLSWPLLGMFPSGMVWLSVLSGVMGVFLMQQPNLVRGEFASLVALMISLFTALAMIGLHRLKEQDTRAIVVHFSAVSLLMALVSCVVFERHYPWEEIFRPENLGLLLGVGVAATVGQLFLTRAFAQGDPARVSVVGLTQIVFALGLELVLLHSSLESSKLLGIPLVVGPTAWLMWQQKGHLTAPVPPIDPELPG